MNGKHVLTQDQIDTAKLTTNLVDLIGQDTKLTKVTGKEWAGPCPRCGGNDRMHVRETGWFCRKCTGEPGLNGWRDVFDYLTAVRGMNFLDAWQYATHGREYTSEERQRLLAERAEREALELAEVQAKQAERRALLDAAKPWLAYHRNLDEGARALWAYQGLRDEWQDYYMVGYCPGRTFYHESKPFQSPSLTIPTFRVRHTGHYHEDGTGGVEWDCLTVVHRLLVNDPPGGKYRPELAGTGKPLFIADVYAEYLTGPVLLVEGEKKAMVTHAHLQDWLYEYTKANVRQAMNSLTVAGAPGKSWNNQADWVAQFDRVDRVFIALDPDARQEAEGIAKLLGRERCRIVDLPGKIDDLIVSGVLDLPTLAGALDAGRKV